MKLNFFNFAFYPFVWPIYYVLYLFSQNASEIQLHTVVRPGLILLMMTSIVFIITRLLCKDSDKAAFLTFILMFFLLVYGAVYLFLKTRPVLGLNLGRHVLLGSVWLLLLFLLLILVFSSKLRVSGNLKHFLNLLTILLMVFSVVKTVVKSFNYKAVPPQNSGVTQNASQNEWLEKVASPVSIGDQTAKPDIYYILPDMFARGDVIEAETGYDNSAFLNQLHDMGFYVADCSRSNYASTQLSIASSLNLHYLDQIQGGMTNRSIMVPMSQSLLRTTLEELGYKTIIFENGFGLPEITDPDIIFKSPQKFLLLQPLNPFESLILGNSFLRVFYDIRLGAFSRLYDRLFFPYQQHVENQIYILDNLPDASEIEGPIFVFAHIMAPHPPYLIHADGTIETDSRYYREALGQPVTEELYLQGYLMQTQYVEGRLLEVVKEIIAKSTTPPIIIIQGDHGIRWENRLDILNAYYVPTSIMEKLYPEITPVNTFRIVLNQLFGTNYEILPDFSWYSEYPDWFEMRIDPADLSVCSSDR